MMSIKMMYNRFRVEYRRLRQEYRRIMVVYKWVWGVYWSRIGSNRMKNRNRRRRKILR